MKLIVAMGNPGEKYKITRHNAGFVFVDRLTGGAVFSSEKKMETELYKNGNFIFIKPLTFMNEIGRAVRKVMDFYKLSIDDIVVVHDDLDLKIGEYKIQKGIGPKVHNGILSIEQALGDKQFLRVRLGVDNRGEERFGSGADYVLSNMNEEELETLEEVMEEAGDELAVALGL